MTELEQLLTQQNQQLLEQVEALTEQVKLLTQKLYGRSSEKSPVPDENQLSLFTDDELNVFNEAEALTNPNQLEIQNVTGFQRRRKTSGQKAQLIKDLPITLIECTLHEDDTHCEWCNTELRSIGREYVREEVEFIPAQLKVNKIYRHAYECPTCKADGADMIVKAETPQPVIPKSLASASSVAWLLHQKFEMSLPFHRQEKEWESYGITLNRTTMANWVMNASKRWLTPLYEQLHEELLKGKIAFADETTMQVLNEPGRKATSKSYMWLYRNGTETDKRIVLYDYRPTRAGENPKKFLAGFKGYLHCDGYEGYNKVAGITRVGCWAHVRRKFHEGIPKTTSSKISQCEIGRNYCDQLFKLEKQLADFSSEERLKKRQEEALPILNEFWQWVGQTNALPHSLLGKALSYAKKQKPHLMNYLQDGDLHLSNNLAERSVRPFVVGRKSWNFSTSVKGAKASAVAYSLIETAKENGLNAYKYLSYLFEELPNVPFKEEPDLLQAYLPWSSTIQQQCR